jgi:hypothetical protein
MLRLLRLVIYVAVIVGIVWFGSTVELGKRTLFGHIQNIWKTHESQELMDGTKGKVGELVNRASDRVVKGVGSGVTAPASSLGESAEEPGEKPMEEVQNEDRKTLRDLIGRKTKPEE